jgi:hypothetical protein
MVAIPVIRSTPPEKSVLKYTVGEKIKVKKVDFERLAAAFF